MRKVSRPPAERPPSTLLAGKLTAPLLQPGVVTRNRLLDVLDETRRLCLVVAPAGWGKTTLLTEWARQAGDHVAWLTLDETDDEPHRFWTYVVTALRTAAPDLGGDALAALRVPGIDPLEIAVPALLNDLSASESRHALILDDYHLLTDVRIHEAIEYLLSYLSPSLRLVIAARFDPPLPLARMRARGELSEIRAADLRFRATEAAGLVSAVGQVEISSDAVDALVDRTEGWAVGLKLAALTIRSSPDPAGRAAAVRGDDRHIIDFLSSEVLDRLPADRREFLVQTAVLDRLCGSLCDAVLGRTGSAAVLEALERADLFVVPLDAHREWYRYHRLFRDVLTRELKATSPGAVPELLRRAADWYLTAGQVDEAVRLLLAAGDRRRAAEVLLPAEDAFLEQGAAATYLRLGDQLGEVIVRADPRLAVSMAGAAGQSGQLERLPALLDIAEASLQDHNPPFRDGAAWRPRPRSCGPRTTRGRAPIRPRCWRRPSERSAWRPIRLCRVTSSPGLRSAPCFPGLAATPKPAPYSSKPGNDRPTLRCRYSSACRRPVCWPCACWKPAGRMRRGGWCIRFRPPCRRCWTLWGMRPLQLSPF